MDTQEELVYFAQKYKIISSMTLREKAEYNSNIALMKNKKLIAKLWLEFADIFC